MAVRETDWREWLAVMAGDVVHDQAGRAWSVVRVAHESGGRVGDGALTVWTELEAGGETRVMRVPDATARVVLDEGPGWGVAAVTVEALEWSSTLVGNRLGGTVMDTGPEVRFTDIG